MSGTGLASMRFGYLAAAIWQWPSNLDRQRVHFLTA